MPQIVVNLSHVKGCPPSHSFSLSIPLQQTISIHLQKMPELAKLVNTDLSKGFTVSQVAEKHDCPEPLVWSIALEGKSDVDRFKALNCSDEIKFIRPLLTMVGGKVVAVSNGVDE